MIDNSQITVEHIIAKIDNDFNPDNSDWIPRVAAWCTDAMSQLKVLNNITKKRQFKVINKTVKSQCCFDKNNIKVYDSNGCEIKQADNDGNCCNNDSLHSSSSTEGLERCNPNGSYTREILYNPNVNEDIVFTEHVNTIVERERHNVKHIDLAPRKGRNYVLSGNTITLNFDDTYITIAQKEIETKYSEYYHCEIPVIPNNGLLAEALAYYCMYKMLCRGYKHPVFNLSASQYGTNPYYMWMQLKDKAKASVINSIQGDDNGEWRNFFINSMMP